MLRPWLTSLALAALAAAFSYRAATAPPTEEAPEQREARFAPDGEDRFVDAYGCTVTCFADVETDFGHCDRNCTEVSR